MCGQQNIKKRKHNIFLYKSGRLKKYKRTVGQEQVHKDGNLKNTTLIRQSLGNIRPIYICLSENRSPPQKLGSKLQGTILVYRSVTCYNMHWTVVHLPPFTTSICFSPSKTQNLLCFQICRPNTHCVLPVLLAAALRIFREGLNFTACILQKSLWRESQEIFPSAI